LGVKADRRRSRFRCQPGVPASTRVRGVARLPTRGRGGRVRRSGAARRASSDGLQELRPTRDPSV
jgi:hypothetical protein